MDYQKLTNKIKILKHEYHVRLSWDRRSAGWGRFLSPEAPSTNDIANYFSLLQDITQEDLKNPRILILGVTPEIRQIASDFSDDITLADFSLGMIKMSYRQIPLTISPNEKKILINWFNLKKLFVQQQFDVILGDLIFQEIMPASMDYLLDTLRKILKPDGFFITRVSHYNPKWNSHDAHSILYDGIDHFFEKFDDSIISDAVYKLYNHFLDPKSLTVKRAALINLLTQEYEKSIDQEKRKTLAILKLKAGRDSTCWTLWPEKEFNDHLLGYFKVLSNRFSEDYDQNEYYPLSLIHI